MAKSKWFTLLAVALVIVAAAGVAQAGTDTYDSPSGASKNVGGIPYCVTFGGTDGGSGAMTVTLPAGFIPTWAFWGENMVEGAAGNFWFWTAGMTTATFYVPAAGSAFSYLAAGDQTASSGSFVIDDDSITDDAAYHGVICR